MAREPSSRTGVSAVPELHLRFGDGSQLISFLVLRRGLPELIEAQRGEGGWLWVNGWVEIDGIGGAECVGASGYVGPVGEGEWSQGFALKGGCLRVKKRSFSVGFVLATVGVSEKGLTSYVPVVPQSLLYEAVQLLQPAHAFEGPFALGFLFEHRIHLLPQDRDVFWIWGEVEDCVGDQLARRVDR